MDLQNKRIPDQEFYKIREEVLQQWPTGKAVNLDEAIAYHKSLPDKKVFSKKLIDAKNRGVTPARTATKKPKPASANPLKRAAPC